jgi:hypothetical protein
MTRLTSFGPTEKDVLSGQGARDDRRVQVFHEVGGGDDVWENA